MTIRTQSSNCHLTAREMQTQATKTGRTGGFLFAMLFVLFCVFLLTQLGAETKYTEGKTLLNQPRFWPAVSVIGMLCFGLGHLFAVRRTRNKKVWHELLIWLSAFEYLIWFMLYVKAVTFIGYLPATILFMLALCLRLGYRSRRSLVLSALTACCIVLVFKTALAVKIPGGALYEFLPAAIRNFMIVNF